MARILIVDDDKMTRVALEAMLRNEPSLAGFDVTVTTAEDGHAGLAALAEAPPDIAIVDLLMPRLDGFETCKALRGHPRGVSIELCVISGVYRDAAIERRVESELGARFFAKPDGLRDLVRHVGELLARRRAAEARPPRPRTGSSAPPQPAPDDEPVRAGDLAFRSLAAVLLDLHDTGATGRLTLRGGRVVKTIDLAEGNPVGAASGTRDETLGHFLVGAGIITDDQHKLAVNRAVERGEKFGEALVAMGMITPARLAEMLTAQVRHKLVTALRWPQGAWRFQPGPLDDARDGLRLRMIDVVLGGLAETSTPKTRDATLDRLGVAPIELTARGRRMTAEIRKHFGARVPDVLAAGGTISDLEQTDVDRAALLAAIDALSACDALTTRVPELGPGAPAKGRTASNEFRTAESTGSFIGRLSKKEGTVPEGVRALYEQLFEDVEGSGMSPIPDGEAPVDLDDDPDSGVIDIGVPALDEGTRARQALLKEYLRVQGLDPYAVLMIDHQATAAEISAALAERQSRFLPDYYARFNLGADQAKLDAVQSAYERARTILLDDAKRTALDRELSGSADVGDGGPSVDAELAYRGAEDLLARRNFPAAIARLQAAVAAMPEEADYHAALGWAHWLAGGADARAADLARPHLNQALAVNPDHAAAHEYKGRIDAVLGTDDLEALFHLERALSLDPTRADALTGAEEVYLRRGEAWPLVRLIRKVLHHLRGRGAVEVALWTRLAAILRDQLDDVAGARNALEQAQKLAPNDPAIAAAIAKLEKKGVAGDPWSDGVARWKRDFDARGPGVDLLHWASEHGRFDAAYLAASALVALGHDVAEAEQLYQRNRPRFVVRAQRHLTGELWALVRHPDDAPDIGALMELVAPAAHALMPMTLDDLEIDDSMKVADADLPESFRRLRSYLAGLLGIAEPTVYVRTDFGRMLHVGALAEPVLLAGDDALANPERAELAFRLARAMTFLWPGRAIGGSRPARVAKSLTLALIAEAAPTADAVAPDDESVARAREALDVLAADARAQARALVLRLMSRSPHLNLSRWARALARTADRIGLLVSGDLPAARRYAADGGATDDDLVEFALGAAHLRLRAELGLSIDV